MQPDQAELRRGHEAGGDRAALEARRQPPRVSRITLASDRRAIVEQTNLLRDQAKPYRGQLTKAYESGDIAFLQGQQQLLTDLANQLTSRMRLPRLYWKRIVIPVRVKLPFVELEHLSVPIPTPSPFRKPHLAFLHDWASRGF
ncbi:MAG: hypothetical protein ACLP7J_17560 [Streptosporangiaceae bacterium]